MYGHASHAHGRMDLLVRLRHGHLFAHSSLVFGAHSRLDLDLFAGGHCRQWIAGGAQRGGTPVEQRYGREQGGAVVDGHHGDAFDFFRRVEIGLLSLRFWAFYILYIMKSINHDDDHFMLSMGGVVFRMVVEEHNEELTINRGGH